MASLTNLPKKFSAGHQIRPRSAQRVNPIKAIQDREWRRKQLAAAAAAQQHQQQNASGVAANGRLGSVEPGPARPANGKAAAPRQQCPNKNCPNPNVVDGTCRTCGRVADDSNIVAEVSFGENAQGAAVVQGSFLGHDQGTIRPMAGIGHRRVAGNGSAEARERSLREARMLMTGYAHQLNIPEHTVTVGFQYYKLASGANFVQGRKIQNVVAVCLYAACRKSTHANPCKIMLIDLADLVKEEVFFLGRTFKKLLQTITVAARDVQPIYVEDLIFRFASKLEFDTMTNKVAETAVRLVQRMDRDWMVMGRRPAGICGACLIMAARMYNFRRTVREVVYIAKVTMATLQMRLDEFKELPSAKMTVEQFLAQDFLTEEYDPPSIYKKSEEYQAKVRARRNLKRKRKGGAEDSATATTATTATTEPTTTTAAAATVSTTTPTTSNSERVVDADGFTVPPIPQKNSETPEAAATTTGTSDSNINQEDQHIIDQALDQSGRPTDADGQLDALAQEYGDGDAAASPQSVATPASTATTTTSKPARRIPAGSSCRTLPGMQEEPDYVDDAWRADEDNLEKEMSEAINSPGYLANVRKFATDEQRALLGDPDAMSAPVVEIHSTVSDSAEIGEDEFGDDPEVQFCLLSEAEAAAKEKIWMNENRAYLRMRQEREFRAKMAAAHGTKKQTRRRLKKPKIGEGQTTPASTPGEAAVEAMERRGFSKRINYDAMRRMLDRPKTGASSIGGSKTAGSVTGAGSASVFSSYSFSRAGSPPGGEDDDDDVGEEEEEDYDDTEINPFADDGPAEEEEEEFDEE